MSSFRSGSVSMSMSTSAMGGPAAERFTRQIEINEWLRNINESMDTLEKNFKNLSEKSAYLNLILTPVMVKLKENLPEEYFQSP